ncbi:MAG: hypothetical protein UV80_C0005G0046 [Candidatus Peregrinibacteria bacterium GW2011_GWF2_43_17]|nr:MAG: hypothetical protein UV80_C0005G0046 [Candidatus Peregrinibacteria bacterium GW2011_GWF2_43_17]KKT19672.1 MAG: hypothetical protein UW03_C0015G0048 [Candidatus Peregrinibacteria bacterium GW2011_GWA2_43_8]HAU40038.1 hypothetical protein [Candidatus Peregrinibacteria bacterium]
MATPNTPIEPGSWGAVDESEIPTRRDLEAPKPTSSKDLVACYNLFQQEFPGDYRVVYSPCCAYNVSPSMSFPNSRVVYVDLDQKAMATLGTAGYEAHCEDAIRFSPNEPIDVAIILNPSVRGADLVRNLKPGGYVLCNDYHGTATGFRDDTEFEFVGIIIPTRDHQYVADRENLEECWQEVATEEEFKSARFTWGGANYLMAALIVRAVTGKEENVLAEYRKIIEIARKQEQERNAAFVSKNPDAAGWMLSDSDILMFGNDPIPTKLPRKKGTVDDIFIFRKKSS